MPDDSQAVLWVWEPTEEMPSGGWRALAEVPAADSGRDTAVDGHSRGGAGRRPLTDGGRDAEPADSDADGFPSPDPDEDPFLWPGDDRDTVGDPANTDGQQTDEGDRAATTEPAPGTDRPEQHSTDASDSAATDDTNERASTSDKRAADVSASVGAGPSSGEGDVEEMHRRLERLSDTAEELTMAAINADLKHARGEDREVTSIHDQLQTLAQRVDDEVDRLEDALEALQRHRRAPPAVPQGRTPPMGAPTGRLLPSGGTPSPARQPRAEHPRPAGGGAAMDESDGQSQEDDEQASPESELGPGEFLIPGAKLRDMWRAPMNGTAEGSAGRGERWILETTRQDALDAGETYTFPPEVTEFTLAPDEVPFDRLIHQEPDDE